MYYIMLGPNEGFNPLHREGRLFSEPPNSQWKPKGHGNQWPLDTEGNLHTRGPSFYGLACTYLTDHIVSNYSVSTKCLMICKESTDTSRESSDSFEVSFSALLPDTQRGVSWSRQILSVITYQLMKYYQFSMLIHQSLLNFVPQPKVNWW